MLPVLFIGHGSPMNALEENRFTRRWREIGRAIPRPKAILCVSAHWVTDGTCVTAMERPRTIHDFSGFPKELGDVQYPAPGSLELAQRVQATLLSDGVELDTSRGLDHGAWSVLRHLFPEADVPVVQLSVDESLSPRQMSEIGARLRALRDEVLIIGAGNVVHNLRAMRAEPHAWASEFEAFVKERLEAKAYQALIEPRHPAAALATDEHYLPLIYALGAAGDDDPMVFNEGVVLGAVSMLCVAFGLGPD